MQVLLLSGTLVREDRASHRSHIAMHAIDINFYYAYKRVPSLA